MIMKHKLLCFGRASLICFHAIILLAAFNNVYAHKFVKKQNKIGQFEMSELFLKKELTINIEIN